MKNTIYTLVIAVMGLMLFSKCQEPVNPFLSKEEYEAVLAVKYPTLSNIAFIQNDEIFITDNLKESVPVKVNAPAGTKKHIKINHKGDRLAYVDENEIPVIINREGEVLKKFPEYAPVSQMNWTPDDKTFYMLVGNEFKSYGEPLDIPEFYIPEDITMYSTENYQIIAADISPVNKDLVYIIKHYDYWTGYHYTTVLLAEGQEPIDFESHGMYNPGYVKYSVNGDLLVGYRGTSGYSLEVIEGYHDLEDRFPDWEMNVNEYKNPIYRKDLNYIFTINEGVLRAIDITEDDGFYDPDEEVRDVELLDYSPQYADWK